MTGLDLIRAPGSMADASLEIRNLSNTLYQCTGLATPRARMAGLVDDMTRLMELAREVRSDAMGLLEGPHA